MVRKLEGSSQQSPSLYKKTLSFFGASPLIWDIPKLTPQAVPEIELLRPLFLKEMV